MSTLSSALPGRVSKESLPQGSSPQQPPPLSQQSVLLVGMGGLGCPAALALVQSGVGRLVLCDDDQVDEGNLHRQILYCDLDIGTDKTDAAIRSLSPLAKKTGTQLEARKTRLLPETARALVRGVDLVVEGADNFATKFLAADACFLENRPIVHGAAIRWHGTAWAIAPGGQPCYRCLFEDIPTGHHANCESDGVMGPVVGVVGAMMAELALRTLRGRSSLGMLWTFDGLKDRLRQVKIQTRPGCSLCGASPSIAQVHESRYLSSSPPCPSAPSGSAAASV